VNGSNAPTITNPGSVSKVPTDGSSRIASIDALRGLVVFTMIFVNDLAGAPAGLVPPWMKHFHGTSGMTFVDLVFPAFLFIVGMSLPLALSSRLRRVESPWKMMRHVAWRTFLLLLIGILMVNETPDSAKMGWSGSLWCTLMYLSAILACCAISPFIDNPQDFAPQAVALWQKVSAVLRTLGMAGLACLALLYRGADGHRILSFSPPSLHHEWYGILGLIGWAYLVSAIIFLVCGTNRTALLASMALLMCLYPADRTGTFRGLWLAQQVGIGETLGSQAAITVGGMLLATGVLLPGSTGRSAAKFALLFMAGCSAGAVLLHGLYGINKNQATPSWCLWACAVTAGLWLIFNQMEGAQIGPTFLRTLAKAGQNVILAYLISEMLPSLLEVTQLSGWYDRLASPHLVNALARSTGCAALVLAVTVCLNTFGFRLRL
jgi:predicted acyltransferase